MDERFPKSMKVLREKFSRGTLVQARFILDDGDVVEFQGLLEGDTFDKVLASVRTFADKKSPGPASPEPKHGDYVADCMHPDCVAMKVAPGYVPTNHGHAPARQKTG